MPSLTVKGMTCNHCKMSVTKALEALPGVSAVNVDLLAAKATFEAPADFDLAVARKAIEKIGFEVPA